MIIEEQHKRARVVKGWAFMDLDESTTIAVKKFLESGDTDDLAGTRFHRTPEELELYLW